MTLPQFVFVVRSLISDTLRQAHHSGMTWVLVTCTVICVLLCLSIGFHGDRHTIERRPWENPSYLPRREAATLTPDAAAAEGVDLPTGEMTILFGAFRVPVSRSRAESVRFLELLLAGGVADTAGIFLALIWTAGFLPSFLDPSTTSVLLAKPAPRWLLLIGKFVGVILFVGIQAGLFISLTWLALGIRTGVWDTQYFIAIPILLFHFATFFCVSMLLAVLTRSTTVCVIGTLAFWLVCWAVNYSRHAAAVSSGASPFLEFAYWVLPKPADFGVLLMEALQSSEMFSQDSVFDAIRSSGEIRAEWIILTSLLIPALCFLSAIRRLSRASY